MDDQLTTGVWDEDPGTRYFWYETSYRELVQKANDLRQNGLALRSIDACLTPTGTTWSGVWEPSTAAQELATAMSLQEVRARNTAAVARNQGLVSLRAYPEGASTRWAAVWRADRAPVTLVGPLRWSEFWQSWLRQHAAGMHLVDVESYEEQNARLWMGVWRPGQSDQYLWVGATWPEFWAKHEELRAGGYGPLTVRSYADGAQRRWAGCWAKSGRSFTIIADMTSQQLWTEMERQLSRGLRLSSLQRWVGTAYAPSQVTRAKVVLQIKVLFAPTVPIEIMVERMREVYEPNGIAVEINSIEAIDRADLVDVDVGACTRNVLTAEQNTLFSLQRLAGDRLVVVYFVRTTLPPYNGCAAHHDGRPALVVSSYATEWTLAHEVGHVLGLSHVSDTRRLMTGLGTSNIIEPPPDLEVDELRTMFASPAITPM